MRILLILILTLRALFPLGTASVSACADWLAGTAPLPPSLSIESCGSDEATCACCCDPVSCPCEMSPAPVAPAAPRQAPAPAPADTPRLVLLCVEPPTVMTVGWASDALALMHASVVPVPAHPTLGGDTQAAHCVWRT